MPKTEDTALAREISGKNIKFLIDLDGSKQDAWGDRFGLGRNSVNNYINKKTLMQIPTAQKVCAHYKLDLGKFYGQIISKEDVGLYANNTPSELLEPEASYSNPSLDSISKEDLYKQLQKEKAKVKYLTEALRNL